MSRKDHQEFPCGVVHEIVHIHLCRKPSAGLRSRAEFFVQCDQDECQYVDRNTPPCPLDLSLFKQEIQERETRAQQLRESSDRY